MSGTLFALLLSSSLQLPVEPTPVANSEPAHKAHSLADLDDNADSDAAPDSSRVIAARRNGSFLPVPQGPLVVAAAGGGLVAAGAVAGIVAMIEANAVEKRAAGQMLVFPRDAALYTSGIAMGITANVLCITGAIAVAAAGAWWGMDAFTEERTGP